MRKLSPFVSRLTLVLWNFTRCRDVNWLIPLEKVVEICNEEPEPTVGPGAPGSNGSRFDYMLMQRVNGQSPAPAHGIGAPGSSWLVEWRTGPPAGTAVRVASSPKKGDTQRIAAKKGDTQRISGSADDTATQSLSKFEDLLGQPRTGGGLRPVPNSRPIPFPVAPPYNSASTPISQSSGRGAAFFITLVIVGGVAWLIYLLTSASTPPYVAPVHAPSPSPILPPPPPPTPPPVVVAPPPPPPAPVVAPVVPPPAPVPLGQELSNFLVGYFTASSGTPTEEIAFFDNTSPTVPYFDKQMSLSDIQADMQAYDDQHTSRSFRYAGGTYRVLDDSTYQVTGQVDYSVSTLGGTAPQVGRITDVITIKRINGVLRITSFESPPH